MNEESKVSVNEFQNWLSGVLDFQPPEWVPDEIQWNKILNKIRQLDDKIVTVPIPVPAITEPTTVMVSDTPVNRHPRPIAPDAVLHSAPVKLPDSHARRKQTQVTVHQEGNPQVIGEGKDRVISTGQIHKTSVDLVNDEYQSSFI